MPILLWQNCQRFLLVAQEIRGIAPDLAFSEQVVGKKKQSG